MSVRLKTCRETPPPQKSEQATPASAARAVHPRTSTLIAPLVGLAVAAALAVGAREDDEALDEAPELRLAATVEVPEIRRDELPLALAGEFDEAAAATSPSPTETAASFGAVLEAALRYLREGASVGECEEPQNETAHQGLLLTPGRGLREKEGQLRRRRRCDQAPEVDLKTHTMFQPAALIPV